MRIGLLWIVLAAMLSANENVLDEIKHWIDTHDTTHDTNRIADSMASMFTKGQISGRVRLHGFGYRWKEELQKDGKEIRKDHAIVGISPRILFQSAYFHGIGVTVDGYATYAQGSLRNQEAYLYKGGKDTLNRYDYYHNGSKGYGVLAQAFVEYRNAWLDLKAGRQIYHTLLTASNDGKMIPNTFMGYTATITSLEKTKVKLGYMTRQKLRDHKSFHHLLAYGYDGNDPISRWRENDDAAMHRGLRLDRLQKAGIEDRMFVFEATNKSLSHTTLLFNYTALPDLLSYAGIEAQYEMQIGDWKIAPAMRYIRQFDEGAGVIGGANLKGVADGYRAAYDPDGWLAAARIDAVLENQRWRIAYSQVGDRGDIVAPWRGFPTADFTRVMAQYNWNANTKTWAVQYNQRFKINGLLHNVTCMGRVVWQDFDDNKVGVQADSTVYELGIHKDFDAIPHASMRLRWAHIVGDANSVTQSGFHKLDPSADAVRLQFDYLF